MYYRFVSICNYFPDALAKLDKSVSVLAPAGGPVSQVLSETLNDIVYGVQKIV